MINNIYTPGITYLNLVKLEKRNTTENVLFMLTDDYVSEYFLQF